MIKLVPIERVNNISREEFRDKYLIPQKPVVITDLIDDWPAKQKWSLEFFKEEYGKLMVPVYSAASSNAGKNYLSPVKKIPLREYIEAIQAGPTDLRLFLFNIFKHAPKLSEDYKPHTIMDGFYREFPFTFFGGAGAKVALHYDIDLSNVFLSQFDGRKRVVLFAPEYSTHLYQQPFTVASYVDVDNPDYEKFPALKYVQGYETIIERGDTIFIPSGYWHYITYLDAGFSMNQRSNDSLALKLRGAVNIATHYVVDKGMNRLAGGKWAGLKQDLANKKAKKLVKVT